MVAGVDVTSDGEQIVTEAVDGIQGVVDGFADNVADLERDLKEMEETAGAGAGGGGGGGGGAVTGGSGGGGGEPPDDED
ncbi:MAG: hypothetical protein GEV28_20905 [Actinophytocola sp.]|uniref:hypothetical protein n=1 Tax=Actinophytocola sp. TaxID=1872138 RepID=UPI00132BDD6C|nr:hypothetical protein [Actinophytocola sp.]MPZ82724.1 hypothetical protein [Actinophytocola sp.]